MKPGDVVRLKSGGPAMTVMSEQPGGGVWCEWFVGKNAVGRPFRAIGLTQADAEAVASPAQIFKDFGEDPDAAQ